VNAKHETTGKPGNNLISECRECGSCMDACDWLASVGESPAAMAKRGLRVEEAFSCSLCGRCEAACPAGLQPDQLFAARRAQAVDQGEIDLDEYSYLLPDHPENSLRRYRQYYQIGYADIEARPGADTCFFPGCSLLTYAPGLTRELYQRLYDYGGCRGLIPDCCGRPLGQIGLSRRSDQALSALAGKIEQIGVRRLVVACPGCYYHLSEIMRRQGVELLTAYEVLDNKGPRPNSSGSLTVHDSCPDRAAGIFAGQVRQALSHCGYSLVEMSRTRDEAPCCGSGGQLSHFRPDLKEALVNQRLEEAGETGASILVAACLSCVLNFADRSSGLQVKHALNLLLGYDEDYTGVKARARQVYENSDQC
jgi:fumarate reductase (CoM/CoB) subunit B